MKSNETVAPIAAIILTYNEEKNIAACLESIAGWCREIFIVDSGSMDATKEICRRYTDRIFDHPFENHPAQWDWALNQLPVTCEWIMPLDADYTITEELRRELRHAVLHPEPGIDGYYARHQYFFWGVPMRGFKSRSLCLCRRRQTRVDHGELVDHRFVIAGKTRNLSGMVYEINRNEWDIDVWTDKHQRYAARQATQEVLAAAGVIHRSLTPSLRGNPDERIIWAKNLWNALPLGLRPLLYFCYRYFLRLGFLDGKVGFMYHALHAFWFRLLIDVKIMQLKRQLSRGEVTLEELKASYVRVR